MYAFKPDREPLFVLTLTAGSLEGTRALLAEAIVEQAKSRGIILRLVETRGSEEALERLDSGGCDLALVQGGLKPRGRRDVRQVAALHVEPLHLLVKPEMAPGINGRLQSLKGRRINLGEPGSGTYCLASAALAFAGLEAGRIRRREPRLCRADGPGGNGGFARCDLHRFDAALSRGAHLVVRHGYRLVGLPFAEALRSEHAR